VPIEVIFGNNVLPAQYLESQEKLLFVEKLAPYYRQAQTSGEQREFLGKAVKIWFERWPFHPQDHHDLEAVEGITRCRTVVKSVFLGLMIAS
jgi:hypothetical protein